MSKRVLFLGGTGEISAACVNYALEVGHEVTLFNRGKRGNTIPEGVRQVTGDVTNREELASVAQQNFDVVCQFLGFVTEDVQRDIEIFADSCSQYIFISSASAYQKPNHGAVITETTPLNNPYWAYSRNKAACEYALESSELPYTIVRPSHTYRERVPSTVIDGNHLVWRLLNDQPIIAHDEGKTLWSITRSEDFARAFVALFDNPETIGEAYHITDSQAHTWREILNSIAALLQKDAQIINVPTQALVQYEPTWEGPLFGDKANDAVFDNTKIASVAEGWECEISLLDGLQRALATPLANSNYQPNRETDQLIDRIIDENA